MGDEHAGCTYENSSGFTFATGEGLSNRLDIADSCD